MSRRVSANANAEASAGDSPTLRRTGSAEGRRIRELIAASPPPSTARSSAEAARSASRDVANTERALVPYRPHASRPDRFNAQGAAPNRNPPQVAGAELVPFFPPPATGPGQASRLAPGRISEPGTPDQPACRAELAVSNQREAWKNALFAIPLSKQTVDWLANAADTHTRPAREQCNEMVLLLSILMAAVQEDGSPAPRAQRDACRTLSADLRLLIDRAARKNLSDLAVHGRHRDAIAVKCYRALRKALASLLPTARVRCGSGRLEDWVMNAAAAIARGVFNETLQRAGHAPLSPDSSPRVFVQETYLAQAQAAARRLRTEEGNVCTWTTALNNWLDMPLHVEDVVAPQWRRAGGSPTFSDGAVSGSTEDNSDFYPFFADFLRRAFSEDSTSSFDERDRSGEPGGRDVVGNYNNMLLGQQLQNAFRGN